MDAKVEKPVAGKQEIKVTVSLDDLTPKFNEAYQEYKKNIQIGGFRKGKVPMNLIQQMFGKGIRADVAERSVPEFFEKAVTENEIKMIPPGEIKEVNFEDGKELTFTAEVELEPEVELKKYKGFKFEKTVYEVDQKVMDDTLNQMRESQAVMNVVDKAAEDGDYLTVDMQKTDEAGVPDVSQKYSDQVIFINKDDEISYKLGTQLLGAKAGDARQVTITPPETASDQTPIYYLVTVKEVKVKTLPELDDELAKDVSEEFETLADLKKKIQEDMELRAKREGMQKFLRTVSDKLIEENEFEVPEKMVDWHLEMLIDRFKRQQQQQGQNQPVNEQAIREQFKDDTIWDIRFRKIKDKIAEVESIELEDADYDAYMVEMADMQGVELEKMKEYYQTDAAKESIKPNVLERKVINFVIDNSKVKEKKDSYSNVTPAR